MEKAKPIPHCAFILAAGLGLRMRPLTEDRPKPLVPVNGTPLIDYSLDLVAGAGIGNVVVNASYKAAMLEEYLAARPGMPVQVSREETPLETGGGIREALPLLGSDPFITINSDVICIGAHHHPLHRLRDAWQEGQMDALLLLHPLEKAIGFSGKGDFFLTDEGRVRRRGEADRAPYVYAGIQLVHPRLFEGCPPEGPFSLNVLYDKGRTQDGTLPRIGGIVHDGQWLHVGDKAGLSDAEAYFATRASAYA